MLVGIWVIRTAVEFFWTLSPGPEDIYPEVAWVDGDIHPFLNLGQSLQQCEGCMPGVVGVEG